MRGCSSVGRASVFQTECREFESRRPLQRLGTQNKRPCGSVVEHSLGKGEVAGPIPAMGTKCYIENLKLYQFDLGKFNLNKFY